MGLLATCDMAISADSALFGLSEVKVGVFPMQVLSVIQRIIPSRTLYELCLTGELIDAHEAMSFEESISLMESQIGLVSMSEDAQEGILAFREKRKPIWTGS